MGKSERTKESMIVTAIALIEEENGDTEKVTMRKIAARSGVSVGLINHYFSSKEILIEQCVQRIIGGVIRSFRPELSGADSRTDILKSTAKQVIDFLMENRQISRISILGDCSDPKERDNTMGTVYGIASCISQGSPSEYELQKAFLLTSMLQASFLRKDVLKQTLHIDFADKSERDRYIDTMIETIYGGE